MPDMTPGQEAFLNRVTEDARAAFVPAPSREQHWPGSALSVWQGHADTVLALLRSKEAYGDSWKRQGYMGNLGRVLSKCDRLRNILWKDDDDGIARELGEETVLDTLYDLSALCALTIANLEEGNRWGQ